MFKKLVRRPYTPLWHKWKLRNIYLLQISQFSRPHNANFSILQIQREEALDGCGTLVLDWTWSLQMRHFLTRGEQSEQVAMCPHGPNSVSRFISEQTMHSSRVSLLLFRDGLREPTWPLGGGPREEEWRERNTWQWRERRQGSQRKGSEGER